MNAKVVEQLIAALRQRLELQRAEQSHDLPLELQDARLSEFLKRHAKTERERFDRETRQDVRFAKKLNDLQAKAGRLIEGEFTQEVAFDRKIHDLEQAIAVREKTLQANAATLVKLSKQILALIAEQWKTIDQYISVITRQPERLKMVEQLLKLEKRKGKLLADKIELLRDGILQRNMVLHNRGLLAKLEEQKRQLIRNIEQGVPQAEADAAAEEVQQFERKLTA